MKKVLSAVCSAAILLLTGCTTYYHDSGADYLHRPQSNNNAPYYTEYNVDNHRINAEGSAAVLFWIFQLAENKRCLSVQNPRLSIFSLLEALISPTFRAVSNAKSVALYNACERYKADQLLGVTFDYVIRDYLFFATVDCKVKGFPAKVKGIKMITKKPIILNKWQKIEYVLPHENPHEVTPVKVKPNMSLLDMVK